MSAVSTSPATSTITKPVKQVLVKAFSEEHARRISGAIGGFSMDQIHNVIKTKQPRAATTCKTEDFPVRGTRKWKTVYQVYAYGQKLAIGRNRFEYLNMELVTDDIEQKTEAVKIAKEMAIKHQLPMTVQIAQKLGSHDAACADIEPKSTIGEFQVNYFA